MSLAALAALAGLGAVMLPKAESVEQIAQAFCTWGVAVLPLIESAEGVGQMQAIAHAAGVLRLGLGHIDLQADLGMACGPDEAELAPSEADGHDRPHMALGGFTPMLQVSRPAANDGNGPALCHAESFHRVTRLRLSK